jgi:hypothetical protein
MSRTLRFCPKCGYDKDGINGLGTIIVHHSHITVRGKR